MVECIKGRFMIDWIHSRSFSSGALGPFQHPQQLCELWGGARRDGPREGTWAWSCHHLSRCLIPAVAKAFTADIPQDIPPAHFGTREGPLFAEDRLFKDVQPPCGRGHHWKISRTLWHDLIMTEGIMIKSHTRSPCYCSNKKNAYEMTF